jgi:hypothetical protein
MKSNNLRKAVIFLLIALIIFSVASMLLSSYHNPETKLTKPGDAGKLPFSGGAVRIFVEKPIPAESTANENK